uniref:Uncharacterized protein n=1 Tax=Oryza punctata TaxID=4537 RepID=A0A0E0K4H3_ORYPU
MEMKKIACAVLVAASATVAFAAEAPAPAPTSAASAAVAPAISAALGATVVSFFAYYLQRRASCITGHSGMFDNGCRNGLPTTACE